MALVERAYLVGPHAGGVDHHLRPDLEGLRPVGRAHGRTRPRPSAPVVSPVTGVWLTAAAP